MGSANRKPDTGTRTLPHTVHKQVGGLGGKESSVTSIESQQTGGLEGEASSATGWRTADWKVGRRSKV